MRILLLCLLSLMSLPSPASAQDTPSHATVTEVSQLERLIPRKNGSTYLRLRRFEFSSPPNCTNNEIYAPVEDFVLEGRSFDAERLLKRCYRSILTGAGLLEQDMGFWRELYLSDAFETLAYRNDPDRRKFYADPHDQRRQFICRDRYCYLQTGAYEAVSISEPSVTGNTAEVFVRYGFVPNAAVGEFRRIIPRVAKRHVYRVEEITVDRDSSIGASHVFRFTRFGREWVLRE